MRRDPYEVLGIPRDLPLDEAEDAYHRLLREEHPDVHQNAGPDRLATAELRTRELNAAIAALRADQAARARAGAAGTGAPTAGRARTSEGRPGSPNGASSTSSARADGRAGAGDDAGGWRPPQEAPPATASCPWCGLSFARASELKDHVFGEHDLRLDRRERGSLLGGRMHRLGRKFAHLPLWGVIPVNVAFAIIVGLLVNTVTDETVGLWAASIVMAPTAVALLDRLSDLSG